MLSVLIEYDFRKLGENTLLIPFEETLLATNSCRELLQCVLTSHLELPEFLSTVEYVKMFCVKQQEFVHAGSSSKKEIANAKSCIDYKAIFVIESVLFLRKAGRQERKVEAAATAAATSAALTPAATSLNLNLNPKP